MTALLWAAFIIGAGIAAVYFASRRASPPEQPTAAPAPWRPPTPSTPPRVDLDVLADILAANAAPRAAKLAEDLSLRIALEYADADGVVTEREITINRIDGYQHEQFGRTPTILHAYCHLRGAPRRFLVSRIHALGNRETETVIEGWLPIVEWLRAHGGLLTKSQVAQREADAAELAERAAKGEARMAKRAADRAERAAEAEAWRAELARRDELIAGDEHFVTPTPAQITISRNPDAAAAETLAVMVLGYDTNSTGQPTVLFCAKTATAKRGWDAYIGETLLDHHARILTLVAPPVPEPVGDIAAWALTLPKRTAPP
jgi:hypothetical protein